MVIVCPTGGVKVVKLTAF